jgi:hypothetical protein
MKYNTHIVGGYREFEKKRCCCCSNLSLFSLSRLSIQHFLTHAHEFHTDTRELCWALFRSLCVISQSLSSLASLLLFEYYKAASLFSFFILFFLSSSDLLCHNNNHHQLLATSYPSRDDDNKERRRRRKFSVFLSWLQLIERETL